MILKCSCEHKYQDKKYGKGLRVHNPVKGRGDKPDWCCTVCKKVKGE